MKKYVWIVILLGLVAQSGFAQPWLDKSKIAKPASENWNISELRQNFDKWFEANDPGKGTGYKQFQRYLSFMEPRVYPDGVLPEKALWEAYRQKESTKFKTGVPDANWTPLGPFDVPRGINNDRPVGAGRINCITFHPTDPDVFYVGAPSGGVWKTMDGGANWSCNTDQLPALGVSDIGINPVNPDVLYMVTGDKDGGNSCPTFSYGILKSSDGGENWEATGLVHETPSQHRMRRIIVSPSNPDILITGGGPGLFRSADAGDNWEKVQEGNFYDLEFKPGNDSIVYACTNNAILKSTDLGESFARLEGGLPDSGIGRIEISVTQANPEVVYSVMSNSDSGFKGLYRSSDSGETWETKSTEDEINIFSYPLDGSGEGGIAWYAIVLTADHQDENIIYSGSINIWKSVNGGADWENTTNGDKSYVHVDEHRLDVNPLNNYCYSGNDGGLYVSTNRGGSWEDISNGLSILQIYRMGASYSNPDYILEGSQDNGTYLYNAGQWNSVAGGDGMECAIDPVDPSIMYASYQNGGLMRSDNFGRNFKGIRPTEGGAWITPFQVSPLNHRLIAAGFKSVFLSGNMGDNWQQISPDLTPDGWLTDISFAPSDDKYIYVSGGSSLWGTNDRGEHWELLSKSLPNLYIEDIVVSPSEPDKVFVCFSGYNEEEKIFVSEDGGKNWANISSGLPNVPANSMTINKLSDYALYAGTDLGVYYRNANMDEWVPYDEGLPNVIVNTVEINYKINKIRAATFGRGIWESPIIDDGNWPPPVQLSAMEKATEIVLSWIEPLERSPIRYNIYRDNELYQSSGTNNYIDIVENGMSYTYQITALYDEGESMPTNLIMARSVVDAEIPYREKFDTEAHGWLLDKNPAGWQWGTASDFNMPQLGESTFIAISSVLANQEDKHANALAILPAMDLYRQDSLIISFDYSLKRWQNLDHLKLLYRTPDFPDWTEIVELPPSGRVWTWREFTMNVPDTLLVPEIEFAFHYTDSEDIGYGAAIDEFFIGRDLTGINDLVLEKGIDIFPNPTDGLINIRFNYPDENSVRIEVIDITGRVLLHQDLKGIYPGLNQEVSLRDLNPGNYFLKVKSKDYQIIKPVTKK